MIFTTIFTTSVSAQSAAKLPGADKQHIQYSAEELESTRTKILELLNTVQEFSDTIMPNDKNSAERLDAARKQLEQFSAADLNALRAAIDPSKMNDLSQARAALAEFKPALEAKNGKDAARALPGVEAPDAVCEALVGSGRPSSAVVIAADAVYFAAKILDIALNRGCNQVAVVVVAGVGGGANTSLACIVSDGILFAAEQVRDKVASCDDDFTKRSVDAAVARMETIHADLEDSVTNDNTNKNTIVANDNTNKDAIIANDTANKNAIVANDNANLLTIQGAINTGTTTVTTAVGDGTAQIISNNNANKNTIVANDNTNKDTIVANDNTNTAAIIANANANKEELKSLHLRTLIETDLSSTDGSVFVGLFMTPASVCTPVLNGNGVEQSAQQCGYLDLVRAIVVQTIANLARPNSNANSFLTKGDNYRASGDYRQAYQNYRSAYKAATK